MYDRPYRRGAAYGIADARVRQDPVEAHRGTATDFLRRHEAVAIKAARGETNAKKEFFDTIFTRTADTRNLRLAWDYLSRYGGQAPGPDGLHYDDLGHHETWDLLRHLGQMILDGIYRPGPDRHVQIPKASGGARTLTLQSIIDRTVQRAIMQTIQPFLDPQFSDNSYGFRPNRDHTLALATGYKLTMTEKRWIWLTADIRDAFGSVPQRRLLDVIRLHIPSPELLQLIEAIVTTETGRGIRQGGSLSPLLLNLYCHHHLDGSWQQRHANLPLLRYADDILIAARTAPEAEDAWNDLVTLLRPTGMHLKGDISETVQNLSAGANADWLGYQICRGENGLQVRISERSWERLEQTLSDTHTEPDAPLCASRTILGWIDQQGPCRNWANSEKTYRRVASTAHSYAFDEIPSLQEFSKTWNNAWDRWYPRTVL